MNVRFRLNVLWALVVAAPTAFAQAPAAAALDGHALGTVESLLRYCAKADPASVPALQARIARLKQGSQPEVVARLRQTAAYRKAYDAVTVFAGKVPEQNARVFCSRSPAARSEPLAAGK